MSLSRVSRASASVGTFLPDFRIAFSCSGCSAGEPPVNVGNSRITRSFSALKERSTTFAREFFGMAFVISTSIRCMMVSGWNGFSPLASTAFARWPRPPKSNVRNSRPLSVYRLSSGIVPCRTQPSRSAFTLFWLLLSPERLQPVKMPLRASTQADKYILCTCPLSATVKISSVYVSPTHIWLLTILP